MRRYAVVGARPPKHPSSAEDELLYRRILEHVRQYVEALPEDVVVVSGGANGVDSMAVAVARQRGLQVVEHLPDYVTHGRKLAPLVRNKLIVDGSDVVVAFPAPWSTGTWHAVRLASDAGKEVDVRRIETLP